MYCCLRSVKEGYSIANSPSFLCLMDSSIDQYCRTDALIIITPSGTIRKLSCPFKVLCIANTDKFKQGEILQVYSVKMSRDCHLVYAIHNTPYAYKSFAIIL